MGRKKISTLQTFIGAHKRPFIALAVLVIGAPLLYFADSNNFIEKGVNAMNPFHHTRALTPGNGNTTSTITIPWLPDSVKKWKTEIEQTAQKYAIDPNLVAIIMTIESAGNPNAQSGAGAIGLMQVTPPTARDINVKYLHDGPRDNFDPTKDLFDPATNLEFGVAYLRYLTDAFGTDDDSPAWRWTVFLVAVGYNGGPGTAIDARDGNGVGPSETAYYANTVLQLWNTRHAQTSPTYTRWLKDGGERLVVRASEYNR